MVVPTAPARGPQDLDEVITGGIGDSPPRPDGTLKVRGEFAYSSDLWAEEMLWGATLRSPHPYARIVSIDIGPALAHPGVYAVLTHEDVPGENVYGLKVADTPALAEDVVRYQGEPIALVAADHPDSTTASSTTCSRRSRGRCGRRGSSSWNCRTAPRRSTHGRPSRTGSTTDPAGPATRRCVFRSRAGALLWQGAGADGGRGQRVQAWFQVPWQA